MNFWPNQYGSKLLGRMRSLGCPAHPLLSCEHSWLGTVAFWVFSPTLAHYMMGISFLWLLLQGRSPHLFYGKAVCMCWQGHGHVSFLCSVPLNIAQHPILRELLARPNIFRESFMCKPLYYGVQVQIEISYNQGRLRANDRDRNKILRVPVRWLRK